jgi:hypothetical protein
MTAGDRIYAQSSPADHQWTENGRFIEARRRDAPKHQYYFRVSGDRRPHPVPSTQRPAGIVNRGTAKESAVLLVRLGTVPWTRTFVRPPRIEDESRSSRRRDKLQSPRSRRHNKGHLVKRSAPPGIFEEPPQQLRLEPPQQLRLRPDSRHPRG